MFMRARVTPTVLHDCVFVMSTVRQQQQGANRVWQGATWCGSDAVRSLMEALEKTLLARRAPYWRDAVHAHAKAHYYALLQEGHPIDQPLPLIEISKNQPPPPRWVTASERLIDPALEAQAFAESNSVECD